MAELKTQPNTLNVDDFINGIEHPIRKADATVLLSIFKRVTQCEAVMWGSSIIGFDQYSYTNSKGQHTWMLTGFSPRKQNLSLYIMQGFEHYTEELAKVGKVKTAKSCLYINRLDKIDLNALEQFLIKVVKDMKAKYG